MCRRGMQVMPADGALVLHLLHCEYIQVPVPEVHGHQLVVLEERSG